MTDEEISDSIPDPTVPVKSNTIRQLQRIVSSYNSDNDPRIVDALQNAVDAFGRHKKNGDIDHDQLVVEFDIDTDENMVEVRDNAGGMTLERFENATELDRSVQVDEDSVGGKGRGLWVMGGEAEKTLLETKNTEGEEYTRVLYGNQYSEIKAALDENKMVSEPEISTAIMQPGELTDPIASDAPLLADDAPTGTVLRIVGLPEPVIEKLSDPAYVRSVVNSRFPVVATDDVEIIYRIDGEEIDGPNGVDIDSVVSEQLHCEESVSFEHKDSSGRQFWEIRNVEFYRVAENDIPWAGIQMCRYSEYYDGPVMVIDDTVPKNSKMGENDQEMVAFADADDLAELEDASHQGYRNISVGDMPLGVVARKVYRENLSEVESKEEQEELFDSVEQHLSNAIKEAGLNADLADLMSDEGVAEVEVPATSTEEDHGSKDNRLIVCSTVDGTRYEQDEPTRIELTVIPAEDAETNQYDVFDISVTSLDGETVDPEFDISPVGQAEIIREDGAEFSVEGVHEQSVQLDIEGLSVGRYKISCAAANVPETDVVDVDEWREMRRTRADTSWVAFSVGTELQDSQPGTDTEQGSEGGGDDSDSGNEPDSDGDETITASPLTIENNGAMPDSVVARGAVAPDVGLLVEFNPRSNQFRRRLDASMKEKEEYATRKVIQAAREAVERNRRKEIIQKYSGDGSKLGEELNKLQTEVKMTFEQLEDSFDKEVA